ncbi:hypothetical protein FO519_007633 [Halicephalobus sp. NKZ332]|nr:hypothetical protein FO519_007633 [Halicephalobus sp. NKZ332]
MATRLRSAPAATAGAVTRQDFEKAIKDTPVINLRTARDVTDRLQRCNDICLNPSGDWKAKSKALSEFRGILLSDSADSVVVPAMLDQHSCWEGCIIEGMKELRSSLCREYCITVAVISVKLGRDFFRQVNSLFKSLMNLAQSSTKIMASSAMVAVEYIAEYVRVPKLVSIIATEMTSKSSAIRRTVFQMCNSILNTWPDDILAQQIMILMEMVKAGCTDADVQCRQYGRDAYFVLAEKFNKEARIVFESLDPKRQRMLTDMNASSAASSTHSIVHENPHLPHASRLRAQQNQFLSSRSRSDVNFRHVKPNISTPAQRNFVPAARSRNASPSRSSAAKPRQPSANRPTAATPKPRPNIVPSTIQAARNGHPPVSSPESTYSNGSSITHPPVASIFGTSKGVTRIAAPSSLTRPGGRYPSATPNIKPPSITQPKPPTTSTLNKQGYGTNIKPPSATTKLTDFHLPIAEIPPFKLSDSNGDNNETYFTGADQEPALRQMIDLLTNFKNAKEIDKDQFKGVMDNIKKLAAEEKNVNQDSWQAVLLLLTMIFRNADFSSNIRVLALETVKSIIENDPTRIGDKHEFMIKNVLECVERDDVILNRAVEVCGTALIQTLSIERVKQLLLPLISRDNPRVVIIAGALKLFSHMIPTLSHDEAFSLLQETKGVVQESYNHPETIVRRAAVFYFVSLTSVIPIEEVTSCLDSAISKLVEVYHDKARKTEPKRINY